MALSDATKKVPLYGGTFLYNKTSFYLFILSLPKIRLALILNVK